MPHYTRPHSNLDINLLFWRLPYSLRQKLFRLLRPSLASYYHQLLSRHDGTYSILPMLERRCLFIHIPKCAGISVSQALFGNRAGGHLPLSHYQLALAPDQYKGLFRFTVVRNPYSRLLSAYRFLSKGGLTVEDSSWAKRVLPKYRTFSEFIEGWLTPDRADKTLHFRPQVRFLRIPGQKLLDVDFIAHQESLSKDFDRLCQQLGIAKIPLGQQNRSSPPETDYRTFYSPRARQIATEIYREDLEQFGYKFEDSPPTLIE